MFIWLDYLVYIPGTPGTGKTTLSEHLAQLAGLKYISVSQLATDMELFDGYDNDLQCPIIDEDQVSRKGKLYYNDDDVLFQ